LLKKGNSLQVLLATGLVIALCLPFALHAAQSAQSAKRELKGLERSLNNLQKALKKERSKRSKEEQKLQKDEQRISQLGSQISTIDKKLKSLSKNLASFVAKKSDLEDKLSKQQQVLSALIKQRYQLGDQTPLKLLIKQQDPEQVSRMLVYFDKLRQHQAKQVDRYKVLLAQKQTNDADIDETQQALITQRKSVEKARKKLQATRLQRKKNLALSDKKIAKNRTKITKLAVDKKRLNNVVNSIQHAINKQKLAQLSAQKKQQQREIAAAKAADKRPFSQLKGKLRWPAKGKVVRSFGSVENNLRYDGVLIRTKQGTPVYAVHGGKIVFSDWLRSYGMVLIIDHGSGYLTLYGHNDQLKKKVGDKVYSGETIALAGSSGGNSRPGLYFAIRRNGKTTNPKAWLKR
jgi:septal ring factor EnvC (AmiA/AmiB activator)